MKQSPPQLRVRTEFSFREAYGPVKKVARCLDKMLTPFAACVDSKGTWGHVDWEKGLADMNVKAGFGAEFAIEGEDGRKPRCWVIATNLKQFYNFTSSDPKTEIDFISAQGVIRFSGSALSDPSAFDYIDLNPSDIFRAQEVISLAEQTKKSIVLTSDPDYPRPKDRRQFLAWVDNQKTTPQHLLRPDEWREAFHFLDNATFKKAMHNTFEVAERCGQLKLKQAPIIKVKGDLWKLVKQGKKYRLKAGHITDWHEDYELRLQREMKMIEEKKYASYFIAVADLVLWAKQRMLVGPARGSSAGSLACYLLRITEVDPLPHGLLFERFIDVNRDDLPDIDIDFSDTKRHLVVDYLSDKYSPKNVAKIGSINTLKPRSVMAHVGKKMGIPHGATYDVLNIAPDYAPKDKRFGKSLEDTFNTTIAGQEFIERYPQARIMGDIENHASHSGVHAAGIIVSNKPVIDYCTVIDGIAHVDKKGAEYLNLLKIDALGLRTLGVIEDSGVITSEQLYSLKLDDPRVFDIFNDQKYSGLFQFEGSAQRRVAAQVPIDDFRKIDHVTALSRPGPLGGGADVKYIARNSGKEKVYYVHGSMSKYLSETMGVILYQEQVMRIVREIGDFSWKDTSIIRKTMSLSHGKELFDKYEKRFIKGAKKMDINEKAARSIWNEIGSFGAYGMNKSHTTSYAIISYWCAYLKCYHPIEYAAALLRNSKDDEQTIGILRELRSEGVGYIPFDPELSEANWSAKENNVVGGFTSLVGVGPVGAAKYVEKRDNGGLTDADLEKLSKLSPKINDLSEARSRWGHIYDDPEAHNIHGVVQEFGDLEDYENCVVICKLIKFERRDENEASRVARRNGERKEGQTQFLNMQVVDDSISKSVVARIKPRDWYSYGEDIAEKATNNKDWFLIRGKWLDQYSMISVSKIKCLTNPEMFS